MGEIYDMMKPKRFGMSNIIKLWRHPSALIFAITFVLGPWLTLAGFSWYAMATDASVLPKIFRTGIALIVTFLLLASSLIFKYCLGRKCIAGCLKYLGYLAFFVCWCITILHPELEPEKFTISPLSPKGYKVLLYLCIMSTCSWLFNRIDFHSKGCEVIVSSD